MMTLKEFTLRDFEEKTMERAKHLDSIAGNFEHNIMKYPNKVGTLLEGFFINVVVW